MRIKQIPLIILLLIIISACLKDKSPLKPQENGQWVVDTTLIPEMVSQVDSNRIWQNMLHLTSYPDRANYGENIVKAGEWLYDYMQNLGFEVEYHKYLWTADNQIFFVNPNFGIIRNERDPDRGMITHDGGKTWRHAVLPEGKLFFVDEQTGFVTIAERYIFATTDGGMSWEERNNSLGGAQIYFIDAYQGWINDDNTLYKTSDGGYTWQQYPDTYRKARNFFVADSLHIWTSTFGGILLTKDGGANWTEVMINDGAEQIYMFNLDEGIINHDGAEILFTEDGGYTWQPANGFMDQQIDYFFGLPCGKVWGTYIDQILYSANMGKDWSEISKVNWSCHDIFFTDSLIGWSSTSWGLYRTIDGGGSWTYQVENLPDEVTFENIVCTIPGKLYPEKEILLVGHYDTVPGSQGADDNGSGIIALLEIAEIVSQYCFANTVKIVFFSNEENQLGGSWHYADEARSKGKSINAVINFDLIGYWKEGLPRDFNIEYNPDSEWLADSILSITRRYHSNDILKNSPPWGTKSDHVSFWRRNYSAIWLTEAANDDQANPYSNSFKDILDNVDKLFLVDNIRLSATIAVALAKPAKSVIIQH